jgi:hypothetical protein
MPMVADLEKQVRALWAKLCITSVSAAKWNSHLSECSCSNAMRLRLAVISLQARS